ASLANRTTHRIAAERSLCGLGSAGTSPPPAGRLTGLIVLMRDIVKRTGHRITIRGVLRRRDLVRQLVADRLLDRHLALRAPRLLPAVDRLGGDDQAAPVAALARRREGLQQALADPLTGHLHQAQRG